MERSKYIGDFFINLNVLVLSKVVPFIYYYFDTT